MKAVALVLVVPLACAQSPPTTTMDPSEAMLAKAHAFFAAWHRADAAAVFGDADPAYENFDDRAGWVGKRVTKLVRFVARRN